ncbi:uncharacterized protein PGTG_17258 [Puccinia graminis f. sp. tritici CRL 75-36-700-3]|uniref:Uncharacterized protein n=1 Tax=Puccinia graminis f. sp. tritici (strain CRL 75-36-700-3 / race SCCL) TaxID=418459 RepID=E3L361_PUCGT|nr:uncharacterized protein PGTG_17258 [Puccinia graminis f. sp. tritici CRL 75-36-700-3]EFP90986.1 hypothetical protein PGTG_17258 [Puccinia graminis f. sp. tritici CRL 75-36-700-3]
MDGSNRTPSGSQPELSSYFFFPNYESYFPDDGSGLGSATNKHDEPMPDSPTYDPKVLRPVPFFRFKHPSSPPGQAGNREAETELILRYLYDATQNSGFNPFPDNLSKPSGSSLSSNFSHSARIPLVNYLKKFWRTS